MSGVGWGAGKWGSSGWGGSIALIVEGSVAARENAIQVEFSQRIYFSGVLDENDASDIAHYTLTPVAGGVGMDGSPVRPVNVVTATMADVTGGEGRFLELTLDRPMSPWPCEYTLGINGIYTEDQSSAMPDRTIVVTSVFKQLVVPSRAVGVIARDIANPQTLSNAYHSHVPNPLDPLNLGTVVTDDTGDYASDDGESAFKMRCIRRLITKKNGFVHLPGYGVGVPTYGKKLAQSSVMTSLATDAEAQIAREPETEKVVVRPGIDPLHPNKVRFVIIAKTKTGSLKFAPSFSTT